MTRGRALMLAAAASMAAACSVQTGAASAATGYAQGANTEGDLGFGVSSFQLNKAEFASAILGGGSIVKVSSKFNLAVALTESGQVLSWGEGKWLGRPAVVEGPTPAPVEGVSGAVDVAAGREDGLALLADGHVEAWGHNNAGQLGDGSTEDRDSAAEVPGVEGAVAVAAGDSSNLALLGNGTVEAWGWGKTSAAPVEGLSGVKAIAAGEDFDLALLENGEIRAWGYGGLGQLGNGSFAPEFKATPVAVSGITTATAIAAGEAHALALLAGGAVMAWGENQNGQLGNGTNKHSATPVTVEGLTATAIGAGSDNSLAVRAGGVPVGWGKGDSGEFGPEGFDTTHPRALPCGLSGIEGLTSGKGTVYLWGAAQEACPFINGLSPDEGPPSGGNEVVIHGSGFGSATAVHFGSHSVLFSILSPSELAVTAPAGSESEAVTVTTPAGTSTLNRADLYTWTAPPVITSITPLAGRASGGTGVSITGTHLGNVTSVTFGGVSAQGVRIWSDHEVTATSPEGSGVVELTVTNSSGTATTQYAYENPPEFGRCIELGAGSGNTGKGCQGYGGGTLSRFEWFPIVASSAKRGFAMKSGGVKIQTPSGTLVKCKSSSASGELTGQWGEAIPSIVFSGCKLGKAVCQTEGSTAGTVSTVPLTTTLGEVPGPVSFKGPALGLLATPSSGTTIAAFTCGTQNVVLGGSFAAPIPKTDKMVAALGWSATEKSGVPGLTQLEGLPAASMTLTVGEGSPQSAGIAAKFSQALEEPAEANTAI
jgi:alpha-tubulin suppressor-like RCC1 family protein